ncbi:hypothetical protein PsorP6_003909 [Peronosclerospora sorghi]|uniref:Uncharacterized protein n=1 Tax=Peronosclerospora sorghi TaxID=230839 RepID=A0ACC0VN42_9STRA|nr:hypothetical protein PsorP6_003909 [Peronosclerospora sorghi]
MGLKKWLRLSASQPMGYNVKEDENEVEEPVGGQRQQQPCRQQSHESHRRHTAWETQHQERPRRMSTRGQQHCDFVSTEARNESDTMLTAKQSPRPPQLGDVDSENSSVSIGADDEDLFVDVPSSALIATRSRATTTPAFQSNVKESFLAKWKNRAGQSKTTEMTKSIMTAEATESEQVTCNVAHNADVALQAQDTEMGVVMHGWLEKCGQQFKTWKWRFFVLRNDGVLSYYTDETLKKLKGSIDVGYSSKVDVSVQSNSMDKTFVFLIATTQRNLMISAPSQRMMNKWIARLQVAGAVPTEPWDPLRKTVKFFVGHSECNHEWKRYDDPTSYIHMEGYLLKRGHVNKNWKNRFFRIERGELKYYTENQSELKGAIPLKDTIVSPGMAQCSDGRKNYFVLTSKDGKFEMHLNAHNEDSMHLWIEALQEAQTALGRMAGNKDTISGLSNVVKRAEEIPLGMVSVLFKRPEDIDMEMQKRTEALIVASSPQNRGVAVGSQLMSIEGRSILRKTYGEARKILRTSSFPLRLDFLLPPYKRGVLIKKSRSGFENWKKRVVVVTNGEIHYFKQVSSYIGGKKNAAELKHRKSFSLYGCYLNLAQISGRDMCIVVARSPSDKLVLQTRSNEERMEWASVIYCCIRMVSQGITSGHIESLQLERPRLLLKKPLPSDLNGSFKKRLEF